MSGLAIFLGGFICGVLALIGACVLLIKKDDYQPRSEIRKSQSMNNLTITITGPIGAGKTCLGAKLVSVLQSEGHKVTFVDEGGANLLGPEYAARCTEPRNIEIRTQVEPL